MFDVTSVLESRRSVEVIVVRQPQEDEFRPIAQSAQRFGGALSLMERVEPPVKIDHALVFGAFERLLSGEIDHLVV
jgi:hypothetical protein